LPLFLVGRMTWKFGNVYRLSNVADIINLPGFLIGSMLAIEVHKAPRVFSVQKRVCFTPAFTAQVHRCTPSVYGVLFYINEHIHTIIVTQNPGRETCLFHFRCDTRIINYWLLNRRESSVSMFHIVPEWNNRTR
jgi:hypothetical protein